MNTTQEQRHEMVGALLDGTLPSEQDIADLLDDANQAEILQAKMNGVEDAMLSVGYALVDVSTDDGVAFEIVRVEE